ncbi:hypothetical protein [Rhodococcus erythropolis]|uniref:hypothetical protein n=1 Tax=Rhodococcus erythropolis TaxID=1833 RepID=UPI0002FA5309|nr:hypothetical protein [Rhodococcus erythropolis]
MNHRRVVHTVCFIAVGYLIALAVWLGWLVEHTPPGTLPYQIGGLLAAFGSVLGFGMAWANRPTRAERKLEKHGLEGWARIDKVTPLRRTVDGELAKLALRLTVPGSDSYSGRIEYEIRPEFKDKITPGSTVTVMVDPKNRDRIMLCP